MKYTVGDIVRLLEDEDYFMSKGSEGKVVLVNAVDKTYKIESVNNSFHNNLCWYTDENNLELILRNKATLIKRCNMGLKELKFLYNNRNYIFCEVYGMGTSFPEILDVTIGFRMSKNMVPGSPEGFSSNIKRANLGLAALNNLFASDYGFCVVGNEVDLGDGILNLSSFEIHIQELL